MGLLWAFIVASTVLALAAGAQAVSLLRARDAWIAQLQGRMTVMDGDAKVMRNQLEAEKILLR
jgi:hypothetical protein